ncbi:MAG: caspase family protein, partial [Cyanobacteria bacterium]|nr:caspase family protein [Cyanobacteriota bacterium]
YEEIGDKFLPRVASKNDLVLFYFSGHGSGSSHDVKGENYLITHDANKNSLFASGIELQELTKVMKRRIDSDRVLIVLDACHSGGADASSKDIEPGSNFDVNMIAGSGQLVICSSEQDQRSYESQRYSNGIFTKKLMEALAKNGQSTKLKDAFNYLVDEVSREVKEDAAKAQTPVMKSQWNGSDLSVGIVPFKPRAFPPTVKDKLAPDSLSVPANSKPPAAKKPGPPKR